MKLTQRDADILRLLRRHRFLRSHHVVSLLGGSQQQILRRLQKLYHHGYIERPLSQLDYFQQAGSHSIVHALGNRGAAFQLRTETTSVSRLDWSTRNRQATRLFLDHALMTSEILVSLELAMRNRTDVRIRYADELFAFSRREEQWHVSTRGYDQTAVIPDAMFAIEHTKTDGSTDRVLYCLEADRGTMPVQSNNPQRTSIARKLIAYETSWRADIFRKRFSAHRVQILTVTNSMGRLANIASCASAYVSAAGLFHFAALQDVLDSPSQFLDSLIARWLPALQQSSFALHAHPAA